MKRYIFTFGSSQPNEGKYVVIEEDSIEEAISKMHSIFGECWCGSYEEEEWDKLKKNGYYLEDEIKMEGIVPVFAVWRRGKYTFGFVLCYDFDTKIYSAYIGVASNGSIYADCRKIMETGSKLILEEAKALFPQYGLNKDNYKYISLYA